PDACIASDLDFLGNRLPDREEQVKSFFLHPAADAQQLVVLLGGSGWDKDRLPASVRYVGHVGTGDHNAFNSTPRAVLNISRADMAAYGFSPATRVFEAAGAGACLTSRVVGIDSDPHYLRQAQFASERLVLPIELREMSVYEIAGLGTTFDFVIFMG